MSLSRIIAFAGLALMVTAAQASELTTEQVVQDLRYFRDVWAAKDRSFGPEARRRMLAFVDQRIESAGPMGKADLALVFAEAAAFSGNNHTLAEIYHAQDVFHALPVSFWWFPEGAIVTRAHPDFRRLLGARIVSIGGVPVKEAAARAERFTPGIASHKRYLSPLWLTRIEALKAIGVAGVNGRARFEFILASGARIEEELAVAPTPDPALSSPQWRAAMVPGKGPDPWPHVLDAIGELPPYLQKPDDLSWTLLRDGALLYVRSTNLSPYTDNAIETQLKAYVMIDGIVKSGRIPGTVVVDLRYNEGGNFFNVLSLTPEIVKLTGPAGRIFVITGRATNSAAIAFAALLKAGAPARTKIVGEQISDHEWFWAEGDTLKAPASGLPLRYTDGYHDWAHGCSDLHRCYWPVVFHGVKAGSLSPDLPVAMTYKQYAAGTDPAMEAIYAYLDRHNHPARATFAAGEGFARAATGSAARSARAR